MARMAPTAAPLETPKNKGSARGFLRRVGRLLLIQKGLLPQSLLKSLGKSERKNDGPFGLVSCSFSPRRDSKRMRIERRGGTLALPIVMDIMMTRIKRTLRKMDTVRTFLKVMIFISLSSVPLTLPSPPRGEGKGEGALFLKYFRVEDSCEFFQSINDAG